MSNYEREQENNDAELNERFIDLFGIPFTWAKQLAEWGSGELSDHWRKVLETLEKGGEQHEED